MSYYKQTCNAIRRVTETTNSKKINGSKAITEKKSNDIQHKYLVKGIVKLEVSCRHLHKYHADKK